MLDTASLQAYSQNFNLVIRHILAGLGHGIHAGRERGAGVEFSEYRAYAPGDEWRRVDWKLLARNDRYYVREAERDSHVAVWLWLDASASMMETSHAGRQRSGLTKLDFAKVVLACIAAIAQRQGDAFGLIMVGDDRASIVPALRGPRHLQRVMSQLNRIEARGALPSFDVIRAHVHFARSPSLIFAVSDFLDWPSANSDMLLKLGRMQHDVRALCVQTQAERDANFDVKKAYCDPEQGGNKTIYQFTDKAKQSYLQQSAQHFEQVRAECRKVNIPYLNATIEQDLIQVLRLWLRLAGRAL
jgi:uncharacterized protein (DUF58 family)